MFVLQSFVAVVLGLAATSSAHPHNLHHLHARTCKHTGKPTSGLSVNATISASIGLPSASITVGPSSAPAPSSTPSKPSNGKSRFDVLFPVKPLEFWTTADGLDGQVPLSDDTFRPTKEIKELTHTYMQWEGKEAMQAHYPNGSYNFQHQPRGGISFYAPGPENVNLATAKEATLAYSVFFPDGFEFVKGGKLPGLYGGDSDEQAVSCSGGSRDNTCESIRLMWRTDGAGEFYTYLPPDFDANQRVCDVPPYSECNSVYGASVGRGAFTFKTGTWNTIAERVLLNDAGQENGEIELFFEGQSLIKVDGLVLRDNADGAIRGIMMQTFFGGSTEDWASPKDQDVYFADFSVAITKKL